MDKRIISAGTVFYAAHGEYSGYIVAGIFKALRDVDISLVLDQYGQDMYSVLASMVRDETLDDLGCTELLFGTGTGSKQILVLSDSNDGE